MTDDSSKQSSNIDSDPKKQRMRQESVVLIDFTRALQRRVEQIRGEIGKGGKIGITDKETQVVNNIMRQGNMEGLIAGVATFVFLRRFPKYLRQRAAQRSAQQQQRSTQGGSYKLDHPSSPFHNHPAAAAPKQDADQRGGFIWRSFQFTLDVTISFLFGVNVTAYMMDRTAMRKSITEIPLLEGTSGFSNHFCGVLVEEYQRQWKYDPTKTIMEEGENDERKSPKKPPVPPFDRKEILRNPQMEALVGIIEFTNNCKKRQALERRIRQERGMDPKEPVEIPAPGVNSSEWNMGGVDEYDDDSFDNGNGDAFGGEKYFGGNNNTAGDELTKDEVSSFVSDQEDSRK